MLDVEVKQLKDRFIELVKSITREGFEADKLLYKLENSDFYKAPASTMFHNSFEGGLLAHSLNVYDNLVMLVKACGITQFSEDTLKIVALFHDLAKMNFYEVYTRNVKRYSDHGSKQDEMGKFDWATEKGFRVKDATERYLFGTHGQNSERMLSYFTPLSEQESAAIIWHHAGMDNGGADKDLTPILNRYPLATLLHIADMMATYIDERVDSNVKNF